MGEAFNKITIYEFFNVLFPGVLLGAYSMELFGIEFYSNNNMVFQTIIVLCLAYFLGLVVSRLGSLLVEPIAKKTGLIRWNEKYYRAEEKDSKLPTLLKDFNMYRSIISLAFLIFAITVFRCLFYESMQWQELIFRLMVSIAVLIIFLLSYRKQSILIERRVNIKERKNAK